MRGPITHAITALRSARMLPSTVEHDRVTPDAKREHMRYVGRMSNRADIDNRLLGTRDPDAHEAESLGALLIKARALGFSEVELKRLAACYDGAGAMPLGRASGGHSADGARD